MIFAAKDTKTAKDFKKADVCHLFVDFVIFMVN